MCNATVPDKSGNSPIGSGTDPHLIPPLRRPDETPAP